MRVSIIPSDQTVVVDGVGRECAFSAPEGVRAIQWDGAQGYFEKADGLAHFEEEAVVTPYVLAWEAAAPLPPAPPADEPEGDPV